MSLLCYPPGMTMEATTQKGVEACAHCGGLVSTRGRAPKSGRRYCSSKACRAAKARAQRRVLSASHEAPTECSGCHRAMPPRAWRISDEAGRWCSRPICRRKRRELIEEVGSEVDLARENQKLEAAVFFLMEVIMADAEDYFHSNRRVCHTCGLTSAIPGWVHQAQDNSACQGTLDGQKVRSLGNAMAMAAAWPFKRRYLSAEEIAAAYPGDES